MCISNILESKLHLYNFTPTHQLHFLLEENTPEKKTNPTSLHPSTQRHPMHHPHPSPPPKNGQKSRCLSWDSTKIRGKESVSFGRCKHQQILYLPVFLCHEKEDFGRYLPKNFVRFKVLTSKQRNSLFGGFKFSIWIIGSCQRCLKEPPKKFWVIVLTKVNKVHLLRFELIDL